MVGALWHCIMLHLGCRRENWVVVLHTALLPYSAPQGICKMWLCSLAKYTFQGSYNIRTNAAHVGFASLYSNWGARRITGSSVVHDQNNCTEPTVRFTERCVIVRTALSTIYQCALQSDGEILVAYRVALYELRHAMNNMLLGCGMCRSVPMSFSVVLPWCVKVSSTAIYLATLQAL